MVKGEMKLSFVRENINQRPKGEVWLLLTSWSILIASYVLKPVGWQAVTLPNGQAVQSFSPIHFITKIPGPTCGLTRSFVNLARLQFGDAFRAHFLGPLLFGALLMAVFYYTYRFLGGKRRVRVSWSKAGLKTAYFSGILLVLGAWISKLILGFY